MDLCQQAERCGASWIAIHGRTTKQRAEPVNVDVIRLVKDSVSFPVVANGDIRCLADVDVVRQQTGVDGTALLFDLQ